jgi:hypothetical protein
MKLMAMLNAEGQVVVAHAVMTRTDANNFGNALIKLGNAELR